MSTFSSLAQVIIGGGTGIITMWVGRISCKLNHKKEKPAPPPPPVDASRQVCGCGHNYAFHELEANTCCAKQLTGGYLMSGEAVNLRGTAIDYLACPCVHYNGPRPSVDETWAALESMTETIGVRWPR